MTSPPASGAFSNVTAQQAATCAHGSSLEPRARLHGARLASGPVLQALAPDAIAAGDPGVAALIHGLLQVLPTAAAGLTASLHGFDPGAGQPRGFALVLAPAAPSATFVAAITGDGPTGLALELALTGAAQLGPATLPLAGSWSVTVSGTAGGRLRFARGGTATVLDGQPPLTVQLTLSYSGAPIELGVDAGPHVTLTNCSVGLQTALDATGNPKVSWIVNLPQAQLSLVADVIPPSWATRCPSRWISTSPPIPNSVSPSRAADYAPPCPPTSACPAL